MNLPLLLTTATIVALALPACTHTTVPQGRTGPASAGRIQPHNPRSISPPRRGGHAIQNWTRNDVTGMTISLIDPKIYETYRFSGNGLATAGFGEKDGLIVAPVLEWRINRGILEISDPTQRDWSEQLRLIEKTPTRITASNKRGKTVVFETRPTPR